MTQRAWELPDRSSCVLVLALSCFTLHIIHRSSRVHKVIRLGDLTQLDYKWKTIRATIHFDFNFKSIPFTLFLRAEMTGFEARASTPSPSDTVQAPPWNAWCSLLAG